MSVSANGDIFRSLQYMYIRNVLHSDIRIQKKLKNVPFNMQMIVMAVSLYCSGIVILAEQKITSEI